MSVVVKDNIVYPYLAYHEQNNSYLPHFAYLHLQRQVKNESEQTGSFYFALTGRPYFVLARITSALHFRANLRVSVMSALNSSASNM